MELVLATGIGGLVATGVWLLLRERAFSVVLGLALLSYAANLFIFAGGRLSPAPPPLVLGEVAAGVMPADPLPQALVLTAIVISFGTTAFLVALALRAIGESGTDNVDGAREQENGDAPAAPARAGAARGRRAATRAAPRRAGHGARHRPCLGRGRRAAGGSAALDDA
jgi:multicomponent K+:H+ antiporter subunit C